MKFGSIPLMLQGVFSRKGYFRERLNLTRVRYIIYILIVLGVYYRYVHICNMFSDKQYAYSSNFSDLQSVRTVRRSMPAMIVIILHMYYMYLLSVVHVQNRLLLSPYLCIISLPNDSTDITVCYISEFTQVKRLKYLSEIV